jgi:hypothetical protein
MRDRDLQGLLAAAESRVCAVHALLARPRACNLEECVTLVREAQGYLEWLRDSLPRAGPVSRGLRPQAAALACQIRQAGVLIEQGALLGRRWLAGLRSMAPEYTASGSAAPLHIRGRISFLG